jgi:hypothetical protein
MCASIGGCIGLGQKLNFKKKIDECETLSFDGT